MTQENVARVRLLTLDTYLLILLTVYPNMSQEQLARHLNVTMRTVQRTLERLEREGYVRINRRQKPHTREVVLSMRSPEGILVQDLLELLARTERWARLRESQGHGTSKSLSTSETSEGVLGETGDTGGTNSDDILFELIDSLLKDHPG
jgi:DNA-binding MarR family transcriptional regulator